MKLISELSKEEKLRIYNSYCKSFPRDEQRDEHIFWQIFENPNAKILMISKNDISIGYLVTWNLSQCIFIEIFEVFEEFRGQNLGSEVLNILIQKFNHLLLESEPAHLNSIAERRINFYLRNGFSIINKDYIQPSYGEGKLPINLWLLGTFIPNDVDKTIQEIYKIVYQKDSKAE